MKQLVAIKYRLYPTTEQEVQLAQAFGSKRWIYNHFLAEQQQRFANRIAKGTTYKTAAPEDKALSNFDINKAITQLKKHPDTEWLKSIDDWCLKHAAEDLSTAFSNFFKSVIGKRKGPKLQSPKFKSKHTRQSFRTRNVQVKDNQVVIPKIRGIDAAIHRPIPAGSLLKYATISKDPDGKYYASVLIETDIHLQPMTGKEVGCDLGIRDLLISSDGIKWPHPKDLSHIARTKRQLKVKQKQFARTTKTSKNHERLRQQVARQYSKITRQRTAYYHQLSRHLVNTSDAIYMENLAVSNMIQNRKLARAIHESAWSSLTTMIAYKCDHAGKTFHKIDRFAPSTKTCSSCGEIHQIGQGVEYWTCSSCGAEHDRDINAATNILRMGQKDLYGEQISSVARTEVGEIPMALQKITSKSERTSAKHLLVMGVSKLDDLQSSSA